MKREMQEQLSRDFGPEAIRQKKGQGGRLMDYVSHGMVTKRLNDVDPDWQCEMVERWITDTNGTLNCRGGVMRLTVGGVTREEAGGPARLTTLADDLKNTYSDCLKRCAMRFGVALSLWESAEENDDDAMPYIKGAEGVGPWDKDIPATPRAPTQQRPAERAQQSPQPFTAGQFMEVIDTARALRLGGDDYPSVVAYFQANRARMTKDQFEDSKEELKRIKAWTPEGAQAR